MSFRQACVSAPRVALYRLSRQDGSTPMGRGARRAGPGGIEDVSQRIEEWRRTRLKRGAMPEEHWAAAAAAVAGEQAVYATARRLRVNYDPFTRNQRAAPAPLPRLRAGGPLDATESGRARLPKGHGRWQPGGLRAEKKGGAAAKGSRLVGRSRLATMLIRRVPQ